MSDLHSLEDKATLYVQGGLTDSERFEFEARMAESVELRALVAELEEGAVALAMAVPRRRAPQQVWVRIEKAVTEETRPRVMDPSLWFGWLRNGWAAAAVCLVGWLLYAIWVNQHESPITSPVQVVSDTSLQRGESFADSHQKETGGLTTTATVGNAGDQLSQGKLAQTREIGVLRWQIVELVNQTAELSGMVTQQQALLAEPSRVKFFQLVPTSDGGAGTNVATPSPELQRALFLAMARELGWSPPRDTKSEATPDVNAGNAQESQSGHSSRTQADQDEIAVVDLQPPASQTSPPVNPTPQMEVASGDTQTETEVASDPSAYAFSPTSTIPLFTSATNAFVAVDSSVAPSGSYLTFWTTTDNLSYQSLGTIIIGNRATVARIPMNSLYASGTAGLSLVVTAIPASGQSTPIHYSTPPATQP